MTVTVHIPTLLRSLTQDHKRIEGSGQTVLEVIDSIDRLYPGLKRRLVADGRAHRFMNIYVNDDDIRFADDLATPVKPGDSLTLLPAVAGGSQAWRC